MSADLLKEFGEVEENPWNLSEGQKTEFNAADDDFGDFAQPDDETQESVQASEFDFLNQNDASQVDHNASPAHDYTASAPISVFDHHDWGEFEHGTTLFDADQQMATEKVTTAKEKGRKEEKKPLPPAPPIGFDDDFGAWEVQDGELPTQEALTPQAPTTVNPLRHESRSQTSRPVDAGPPPSNVPPPSVLLSLAATLLLKDASTWKSAPHGRDASMAHALQSQLSNICAIARIIAGRKLRWRRDTILSQSMRIGQAGKQGGMKLTGVDKTESRREDQEAAEVIRMWKEQVGSLRSAVATLHGHKVQGSLGVPVVPEIAENMPIRSAKPAENAMTAPKACFLCGIRREERVHKVDIDVEDCFGEYWVDHWGHLDCVNFWTERKSHLAQR